jgi:hypothetical protein
MRTLTLACTDFHAGSSFRLAELPDEDREYVTSLVNYLSDYQLTWAIVTSMVFGTVFWRLAFAYVKITCAPVKGAAFAI